MSQPPMIQESALPAAETVIDYGEDGFGPPFLHWLPEGCDIARACGEHGFDCKIAVMEFDLEPEDPLFVSYFDDGDTKAVREWKPTSPEGEGWKLVGQWDTEEGPAALFIRPSGSTT